MKFENQLQRAGRLVRPAALTLVGAALLAGGPSTALAATDKINLSFDVYSGNIRAFKISIGMDVGKTKYTANARIKSKGVVSFVASAKVNFDVQGQLDGDSVIPVKYESRSKSKGKKRSVTMTWDGKRVPKAKLNKPLNDERKAELNAVVKPGMTDPISQLVRLVARNPEGKACNGTKRVYTGKVVDEYKIRLLTLTKFGANAGGAYRGPAYKCEVKFRTIVGISDKKKKKQAKQNPTLMIWYAPIKGNTGDLLVPIAADGRIDGRNISVRLNEGSVSGKSLSTHRSVSAKRRFDASSER